jgi:hypothetical protein
MTSWIRKMVVVAACALGASGASAQQCVGFGDLADDGPTGFCPTVEWIKNRGITVGCAGGANYCPTDAVSRLSMAAFMQRLGKALTTEVLQDHVTLFATTLPGEAPTSPLILCATAGNSTVAAYPRRALLNAAASGLADGNPVAWRAFWLYSTDGGATFQTIMDGVNPVSTPRASSAANQWSGLGLAFALDLPPNTPLQVRVGVRRDNVLLGTTGNFVNVRCQMSVSIVNANGTSSPL